MFWFSVNGKSADYYKGVNVLNLWITKDKKNYTSNIWLTYKQASELGGQVRKGEKSTICAYFDKAAQKRKAEQVEGEDPKTYMLCKPFYLFNANQIDSLPENIANIQPNQTIKAIDECENFINNTNAVFKESGEDMFYLPAHDYINLPNMTYFKNVESYYFAKFHELAHWTGAKGRLNREMGKRFGDNSYAMEELVAQISSAIMAGRYGLLDAELENHVSYIQGWQKALKDDKNAIFSACKLAFEACDYLDGLQNKQQQQEAA